MALSADQPRNYARRGDEADAAAQVDVAYAGGALTYDSNGDVGPLLTSENFAGFAVKQTDNSAGSAGDKTVRYLSEGLIELSVVGLNDAADLAAAVYATDDNTFTLTASGALQIGKVHQVTDASNTKALVKFEGVPQRSI